MAGSTFQTNPIDLFKLLEDCHRGVLQLPDFQRSWVWDGRNPKMRTQKRRNSRCHVAKVGGLSFLTLMF